jgi:predicted flap endonuclease-1-like 5' DNA nuclease
MDAAVASRGGRFFLLGRPAFLVTALLWSVPFWLLFELFNLRLENWYYVFLPRESPVRWAGIALSFATVIPAVLVAERLLDASGLARGVRVPPLHLASHASRALQLAGAAMLLLPLAWPRLFFPLVWGGIVLVVDPWVRARDPARSLLADLERGQPGRILRLLAGGLAIGLLWETFNIAARGKWIYTVPGLEDLKIFEMPVLGFLGFPFFALEAFAVWQALVLAGLAVPAEGRSGSARRPGVIAVALLAAAFSVAIIAAMHRHTIASLVPAVSDLGAPSDRLAAAGIDDTWELAKADPGRVATATGAQDATARAWIERARLATLRGIGAPNATRLAEVGVGSVAALAAAEPAGLAARLAAAGPRIDPARVRVWVRAAREAERSRATRPSS